MIALRPGQRHVMIPGYGMTVHTGRATLHAGGADWWLSGGAPAPAIVYQPIGAASQAAAYVNLITPGTYNIVPGATPPGWDAATGLQYTASVTSLIEVLFAGNQDCALAIRFSNHTAGQRLGGLMSGSSYRMYCAPKWSTDVLYYYASTFGTRTGSYASGVTGMAANQPYRNGSADGAAFTAASFTTDRLQLCNAAATAYIQAAVVWSTSTNHATWMPAVMAAMAAL